MYFQVLIIMIIMNSIGGQLNEELVVNTKLGPIRGVRATDGDYNMFMGIPYAIVNKDNPFGIAEPQPAFEGVFEADNGSAVCPQFINSTIVGTIDCLHLHVYVPTEVSSPDGLAVMFWIHGGAFLRGSGSKATAGPKFLIQHDVIVVSINYRLGPYGFMCLDIPEVPGNQGLKDQLMALRWIKDNIGDFGGDVNRITIFGESAGGHSIDLHLISSNEILYNNVIMQSGSSLAATVIFDPDKEAPIKIASFLGFQTDDLKEALEYIVKADAHEVIRAETSLNIIFKPCVETVFEGVDAFLTKHWVNAAVPKVHNLPILTGFNDDEMIIAHVDGDDEHFKNLQIFNSYLLLSFDFDEEYLKTMETSVRNFYVGDGELNENMKWDIINFDSDFTYIHPIHRSVEKYVEAGAGDIFFYKFSYNGNRNINKIAGNVTTGGAAHADDIGYIFDRHDLVEEPTEEDQIIIDRMTTMWTNFAKYSNPTPETTQLLPITWLSLTRDNYYYININSNLTLGRRPLRQRMAYWDLFFNHNRQYLKHGEGRNDEDSNAAATAFISCYVFLLGFLYLL